MRTSAPRSLLMHFAASWYGYAGRAFLIAFLNLLTFGIYKPYGITRIRRALYGNILIGREALQYEGTARGLGKVTFYPALALFCLLMLPAIIQFMADWKTATIIGIIQFFLLLFYADYLRGLERQYEVNSISWRGYMFSLDLPSFNYGLRAYLSRLTNWLLLGAIAPWRRVWLARHLYAGLRFGRHAILCQPELRPLLLPYYAGWLLSLAGWAWLARYSWQEAIEPVRLLMASGQADPGMANAVDPSLFAQSGMSGGPDSQTLAEIGTWMNAATVMFITIPAGLMWQQFCLSLYEWRWWQTFTAALELQGIRVRFDGSWWGLYWRNAVALFLNMLTANLTRPFTTFSRLRYFTGSLAITPAESLEKLLAPPSRT